MRLYSFTNMYTAGIHAGIQTAHLVHEMFRKADNDPVPGGIERMETLSRWADIHKTIIVLQAGYSENIENIAITMACLGQALGLPNGYFRESHAALNGAWTAAGIVVPAYIYDLPRVLDIDQMRSLTGTEFALHTIIKKYPLAN